MPENPYVPPYRITDAIIHLLAEVSELVGVVTIKSENAANPHLRTDNRIRTIHSSLAIENNSLSLEQVTDVINGKRILGAPNEIREVKNAYEAYNLLLSFDPFVTALGNETLWAKELLARLGLKHRPTLSGNYLHPALELGLIEMTVPDKPNSSRQKYRAIRKIE